MWSNTKFLAFVMLDSRALVVLGERALVVLGERAQTFV